MLKNDSLPDPIKTKAIDYVTSGAKAALGAIPFAGSLLAEIAGSIIPRQRIDRIADFTAKLETRIQYLEHESVRQELNDEEFTDLVEEALRQASRATTGERREYLAALVSNSLTSEAIEHSDSKHLLRLLGELTDVEVIWLRSYHVPTIGGDQEFRDKHNNVLEPKHATLGSSADEIDAYALQKSYLDHLVQIGLVTPTVRKKDDGTPEFDSSTGKPKVSYHRTSALGNLLLRRIGLIDPK